MAPPEVSSNFDTESQSHIPPPPHLSSSDANRHVTLKFDDVVYKVSLSKSEKLILKGVTGIVHPGEMLAMLGPSGSGKTTLLTALGGKLAAGEGKLQGTITYNGETFSSPMRRAIGFVTQDDVLYPHLTVTETLVYTALLRLPNTLTRQEKVVQAEAVIGQLGLSKCKDNGVSTSENQSQDNLVKVKQTLVSAYKTNLAEKLKADLLVQQPTTAAAGPYHHRKTRSTTDSTKKQQYRYTSSAGWPTTWWQQFTILISRGVKERKYESFSGLKIFQVLAAAILSGLLWWQSDPSHLQDKIGLLFFYSGFWGFYPLFEAIFTFPQERRMLMKERSSGMYKLSSFFMSRIVSDLPMELVLPTVFVVITYWMVGFKPTPGHFFHTLAVLLYGVVVASGFGLAIGALVMDQKNATILGSTIMLSFLLASGYYVQHVPPFIAWIKYVSIGQHTFKLLLGSQFAADEVYPCSDGGEVCRVGDFPAIKSVGLDGQVVSAVALLVMIVGYRLIAYLALMRIGEVMK